MLITMTSPSPGHRRKFSGKTSMSSNRKLNQNTSTEKHSGIVDRRYVSTTPKMQTNDSVFRLSKLLMKVTIENRLGAIQMLMLPEDTVGDLIEATLVFYEKEKRRPILMNTDPRCYDLHYSKFTFQSKLTNYLSFFVTTRHLKSIR